MGGRADGEGGLLWLGGSRAARCPEPPGPAVGSPLHDDPQPRPDALVDQLEREPTAHDCRIESRG